MKKTVLWGLVVLILVGVWPDASEAMQRRQQWVVSTSGQPIAGATVTVYLTGTTTKAVIFSDNGVTAKANPITVSATDGSYVYYVANGRYDETVVATGFTFSAPTTVDILLYDPADVATSATARAVASASGILNARDYGCVADGTTDNASCVALAVADAAALGATIQFPGSKSSYAFNSGISLAKAVNLQCARGPSQNENAGTCIFDKAFAGGALMTMSGDGAGNPGAGYILNGIVLRQAFGNGSVTAGQGTALKLTCTSANQRATWLHWDNAQIEEKTGADPWTTGIDIDGSGCNGLGAASTTRDHWIGNGRIQVGASAGTPNGLKLSFSANVHFYNLLVNGTGGNVTITGSSGNLTDSVALAFVDVNGTLALDWAQNVMLLGGRYGTITNTVNTAGANLLIPGTLTNTFTNNAPTKTALMVFDTTQGFIKFSDGLVLNNAKSLIGLTTGAAQRSLIQLGAADKVNIDAGGNGIAAGTSGILLTEAVGYLRAGAGVTFASLPASNNGTLIYCSDCTIANPCAGGGPGAIAKRLAAGWVCN